MRIAPYEKTSRVWTGKSSGTMHRWNVLKQFAISCRLVVWIRHFGRPPTGRSTLGLGFGH